ncbi:MAG: DUF3524 domain-containing protein [Wenzhouxiangellaceae bacterium]
MPRTESKPTAWLLSAYRAASHSAWADWLTSAFDPFNWQRFELPGRHFAWRIRGNPLSWLDELADTDVPDLIVATSMVDLATIRGLHPRLAGVSTLLYFHENQFAYPRSERQVTSIEPQLVQVYAALAADTIAFNSEYNRATFLTGIAGLKKRMPDGVPDGLAERLERKSQVMPVPIEPIPPAGQRDCRLIVWNHRWEYDRRPDLFAESLLELARQGVDFRLALLGPRPRTPPAALQRLRQEFHERIEVDAQLPREAYRALLARAGIAVSTSEHEFQGLAMLEAASAGCIPLVPDALAYPEIYPAEYRYPAGNRKALVQRLQCWLEGPASKPVDVTSWTRARLEPAWRNALLDQDLRRHRPKGQSRDA